MAITPGCTLDEALDAERARDPGLSDTLATVRAIARAAIGVSETVGRGALAGDLGAPGAENADGDVQKALDVMANTAFTQALRAAPVAELASEEDENVVPLDESGTLAVAIDPLDGSSNISIGMVIGTIFGIRPVARVEGDPNASFRTPGRAQTAAGFVMFGPATTFVLTCGDGTRIFTLDRAEGAFRLTHDRVQVAASAPEFSINAANGEHWEPPVRAYVADCLRGRAGPFEQDYNMRWTGALVADAQRVLIRGGVFLYPGDSRKGYGQGRLRLLYETAPIAFLMEQAGAAATDGRGPILDVVAQGIHDRSPLVFGSREQVEAVAQYYDGREPAAGRSPLFGQRGLMRG